MSDRRTEGGDAVVEGYVRPNSRPRGPWHVRSGQSESAVHGACGFARPTDLVEVRDEDPGVDLVCLMCAEEVARAAAPGR